MIALGNVFFAKVQVRCGSPVRLCARAFRWRASACINVIALRGYVQYVCVPFPSWYLKNSQVMEA